MAKLGPGVWLEPVFNKLPEIWMLANKLVVCRDRRGLLDYKHYVGWCYRNHQQFLIFVACQHQPYQHLTNRRQHKFPVGNVCLFRHLECTWYVRVTDSCCLTVLWWLRCDRSLCPISDSGSGLSQSQSSVVAHHNHIGTDQNICQEEEKYFWVNQPLSVLF